MQRISMCLCTWPTEWESWRKEQWLKEWSVHSNRLMNGKTSECGVHSNWGENPIIDRSSFMILGSAEDNHHPTESSSIRWVTQDSRGSRIVFWEYYSGSSQPIKWCMPVLWRAIFFLVLFMRSQSSDTSGHSLANCKACRQCGRSKPIQAYISKNKAFICLICDTCRMNQRKKSRGRLWWTLLILREFTHSKDAEGH